MELIYEIVGETLVKIFEIPNFDLTQETSCYSKICSINNRLHVTNFDGKVFEVIDDKPIENININRIDDFYCFANNTIVWRFDDKIE